MTISILEVLSILPSGESSYTLTLEELGDYLENNYTGDDDKAREGRHRLRNELYCDGGIKFIESVIDDVFEDRESANRQKKWIRHSRYNNVFKRVINELSSVYSAPAKRSVTSGNDQYQELLTEMQFDVVMQQVNRLFNAHQVLLVAPRVRSFMGEQEAVLDIVTPADFRVILHPNDNSLPIGWLTRSQFRSARNSDGRDPYWLLETSHESMMLDERMMPLDATYKEHSLGMSRWVPLTRLPSRAGFWPGEEGEDLVAGAVTIWLNAIFQNKETKSANKQPVLSGDVTTAARGQAIDSESVVELPDGAAISTVDLGTDTRIFRDNAAHALEAVANNYGMASSYIKHQGVQSAQARELMRVPLRELRTQQQIMFRRFEKRIAIVKSKLLNAENHPLAFNADGHRVNFGDAQTPLTRGEEIAQFEKERKIGHSDPVSFLMDRDPDLDEVGALAEISRHLGLSTWFVAEMQDLQRMQSGPSTPAPGAEPEEATTQHERSIVDDDDKATAA